MDRIRRAARGWLGAIALVLPVLVLPAEASPRLRSGILGDYDAEPRRADGHVDGTRLAARLDSLGVTTYCWLVWHRATDWEDLQAFLPLAERSGIDVWAYLVPPSESPPHTSSYSEPYRLDFVRWAEEIARLSRRHPRLSGWIVDDFTLNLDLFTPAYVCTLQAHAHRINPDLAFLPLTYFTYLRDPFVAAYGGLVDGLVVAYLADRDEIHWARALLSGVAGPRPTELCFPWNTRSLPGDFVSATQRATWVSWSTATLRFRERDDFVGAASGYHRMQVLIDDRVVWDEDVAGGRPGWREVAVPVAPAGKPGENVRVTFRLYEARRVYNFGVRWCIDDLRGEGIALSADTRHPEAWTVSRRGAGSTSFGAAASAAPVTRSLPLVVMVAATPAQDEKRFGAPSSPGRILAHLDEALRASRGGWCDGVITFCLDKTFGSALFDSVRIRYREAPRVPKGKQNPARPERDTIPRNR